MPLFADLFAQSKARILVDDPLNALEKIDMDLESDALCGFLQYLYLRDCSEMKKNPKVAIALIRSAHFWEIPNLMNAALQTLAEIRDQNVSRFKPIMNDLVDLQTHVSAWAKEDVMRATVNDIIISIVLQVFNIPEWRVSQLDGVHISSAPSWFSLSEIICCRNYISKILVLVISWVVRPLYLPIDVVEGFLQWNAMYFLQFCTDIFLLYFNYVKYLISNNFSIWDILQFLLVEFIKCVCADSSYL